MITTLMLVYEFDTHCFFSFCSFHFVTMLFWMLTWSGIGVYQWKQLLMITMSNHDLAIHCFFILLVHFFFTLFLFSVTMMVFSLLVWYDIGVYQWCYDLWLRDQCYFMILILIAFFYLTLWLLFSLHVWSGLGVIQWIHFLIIVNFFFFFKH